MDERILVGQVRSGEVAAFAQLVAAYHKPITSYLYHLVRDREVADDLAQDTFLKALRALDRTPPDLNFRAWLYRIATNTAHNHHRRRRLLRWLPWDAGREEGEPARQVEEFGERELVALALRRI